MKHNKLFAMLAVAAALAVSACSGNGGSASSSAHKHTAAPDAPWQHDNNNHWKDCEANDGGKAENAKHTFGDPTDVVPATCTATGSQKVKCTVCGAEVTQTLPMAEHTWGEWEVTQEATCTANGSRKHTCSVCNTEETEVIQSEGHKWGEWEIITEPTCEGKGRQKHTCSVCNEVAEEDIAPLEHDLEAIGGETQPAPGEAAVRVYTCKRCGDTFLGFKADEPSEASLPHLMKGEHDGMRFFGRPIGNALALDETGKSVKEENNECVYCSTETGDFFEYVFTLNADQATTLSTARLYCDARPADYLEQNGGDFWAYGRSSTDWTPGYYIDGADDHVQKDATTGEAVMVKDHARATKNEDGSWTEGVELESEVKMGARIEDYRYILYVDGNPVDFEPDTPVPAKGSGQNMQRAEYVMPYTFHLHEGKNTISLRMAGGYRAEFYNFIFRPYVEPTPVVVNEANLEIREGKTAQITSSMEGLTYTSANSQIATVDANGLVTGVKAGETTITVSKEGNYKDAKVAVKVLEKEGIITLDLASGVVAPEGGFAEYNSSSSGFWLRNAKKDATLTYTFQAEKAGLYDLRFGLRGSNIVLADNFEIKVNDVAVALEGTVNTSYSAVEYVVGQANLKVGENTMVIKCLADNEMYFKTLKFVPADDTPAPQEVVVKEWDAAAIKAGLSNASAKEVTGHYEADGTETFTAYKIGTANDKVTLSYTSTVAEKVSLKLYMTTKNSNINDCGIWYQGENQKTKITLNGTELTAPAKADDKNMAAWGATTASPDAKDSGSALSNPVWVTMIEFDLVVAENTIVIEYLGGGYSYWIAGAKLVK